jgi:TPR repeat protein
VTPGDEKLSPVQLVLLAEIKDPAQRQTQRQQMLERNKFVSSLALNSLRGRGEDDDQLEQARELGQTRTAAKAGDADAAFRLSELLFGAGVRDEAISWLRRSAEAGHQRAMYEVARWHAADEEEAERWYRKLDDGFEEAADVAGRIGRILERRGELEEAEQWYRKAVSQADDPSDVAYEAHYLGAILANRGDREEAESFFQLAAEGGHEWSQISLGTLHLEAGENETAESDVCELAERGHWRAMHVLGRAFAGQGKYAEAERWLVKSARKGEPLAAMDLGELFAEWGDFGRAKYRFKQAAQSEDAELAERAAMELREVQAAERARRGNPTYRPSWSWSSWLVHDEIDAEYGGRKKAGGSDPGSSMRAGAQAEPNAALASGGTGLEELLAELQGLIGLEPVKYSVRKYVSVIKIQEQRRAVGLETRPRSNHLVFVGPPGTGKTTVARLLGRIFHALGMLEHGEVHEVARVDLVANYLGQTAGKTNEMINEALGGVLFIDEAYTLARGSIDRDEYGVEAIDTLMKRMEDDRAEFVVIVAGYEEPMKRFLDANPGLESRFDETIRFPDYEPPDLLRLCIRFAESADYELAPEAEAKAAAVLEQTWLTRGENFGNARLVRNLFEDAVTAQAMRLEGRTDLDAATLRRLEAADIPESA